MLMYHLGKLIRTNRDSAIIPAPIRPLRRRERPGCTAIFKPLPCTQLFIHTDSLNSAGSMSPSSTFQRSAH